MFKHFALLLECIKHPKGVARQAVYGKLIKLYCGVIVVTKPQKEIPIAVALHNLWPREG